MISLRLKSECDPHLPPFVVRLTTHQPEDYSDAQLITEAPNRLGFSAAFGDFHLHNVTPAEVNGDVILVDPRRQIAHRLIRATSPHNTFLITEQCDQLCVMCSQPPKAQHDDMFAHFLTAARLAPKSAHIGLSGGEPLLHKQKLFQFIETVVAERDDLSFHILTNGQHFQRDDLPWLQKYRDRLLWGIPIYSNIPSIHDEIVGKSGAFSQLLKCLSLIGLSGAALELRTVVMNQNAAKLSSLSDFISRHIPFATTWAIMQMERIGYGRMNWGRCFFDNSIDFRELGVAIDIMQARNRSVSLYNFPLCTVPAAYRRYAVRSISDWKQKYLPACEGCHLRSHCSGFFEWYREEDGFMEICAE